MTLTSTHLFPWALSGPMPIQNLLQRVFGTQLAEIINKKNLTLLTLLCLAVSWQCVHSVAVLILCHHSSSIICLSIFYFLSFHSSFSCPTWLLFCLFSFRSPSPPRFFLSSVLSAFFLVLFKSNFPFWWKAQQFFFTYSRLTVLLHQQSIGPYKEMIQRA